MNKRSNGKKPKVIVAMSGGVDSSVAAAVLKEQGFEVVGVFMHFWHEPVGDGPIAENACCSLESQEEARKVAQILGIPFYTVNVAKEFKKEIVDYFIREYKNGRTPNPCVRCNKEIKFKVLMKKMLEIKADYIATGHYARILNDQFPIINQSSIPKLKNSKKYVLATAKDAEKDQSYFLYNLTRKQLARTLFPIGEFENKDAVRKYAEKMKFPVYAKKDSQDICFIPDSTENFLKRHIKLKPGNIVDIDGTVVGKHCGLALYTIGQRKGIRIGGKGPYFVVEKNAKKNELVVSNAMGVAAGAAVKDVNWIRRPAKFPVKLLVRTRYRNPLIHAKIKLRRRKSAEYQILFEEPQKAITPGQSAVFYGENGELIGGGTIAS